MKKIFSLASLLFIFMMTVLPAGISQAATNNVVQLNGISVVLDNGKMINAVKTGTNNFTLDLVGDSSFGKASVKEIDLKSDSAAALSAVPANTNASALDGLTKDDLDIQFQNGVAVLDHTKLINWAARVEKSDPSAAVANTDTMFTVDDVKTFWLPYVTSLIQGNDNPVSPYVFTGYLTDKSGNESPVTITVKTEGWEKVNNTWTYLGEDGVSETGWVKDSGKWYLMDDNGFMRTGWVKSSNKWYYLDASGAMKTGWVKASNKWYYLDASGAMKTGWVKVTNKWYFLYSDGHMAVNTKVGSYKVGKDGAWF